MNAATTADDSITTPTGAAKIPLIAIVDDDESVRIALKSLIDSVGFHAETFAGGEEFLRSRLVAETDCLIADVRMPGGISGLELQEQLNATNSGIPIILISAHDDGDARTKALRAGAVDFLQKPFSGELLLDAIAAALQKG